MRYLAIDLGDKRTGLALGDDATRIVTPLDVIETPLAEQDGRNLLDRLTRAVGDHLGRSGELVVGLPLNMDGSEGPRARLVRAFAAKLGEASGRVVHLVDERLSSAQADWQMARTGMSRGEKKARRDALAAAAILNEFLGGERRAGGRDDEGNGEKAE